MPPLDLRHAQQNKPRYLLCFAGGGMSCKRNSTHISHLKHSCANPGSACFDGFARSVVFRVCLFKIRKHSFGTIRSTGCQRPLILFTVFLVSSHGMVALPLHGRSCEISIGFSCLIDFGVIIFLLAAALPIVPGLVCDTAGAGILHRPCL